MDTTDQAALIAQQDDQRTKRAFIGFLSSALGMDQSYSGQDSQAVNVPRQYQTIGLNGAVGVEGAAVSSAQRQAVMLSPTVLILGALVVGYLVLKK